MAVTLALLGSVTAQVVDQRKAPVVIIGPKCQPPPPGGYSELIVPVDGSKLSEAILPFAAAWSRDTNSLLQLVQVLAPDTLEQLRAAGMHPGDVREDSHLAVLASGLLAEGIHATWETLHHPHPARAINDFTRTRPGAMVAMTTHGRSANHLTALGRVATGVVHDSTAPVLVIKPVMASD